MSLRAKKIIDCNALVRVTAQVLFVVAFEENVAVVFFGIAPMVGVAGSAVDDGTTSFPNVPNASLLLLSAVPVLSTRWHRLDFFAIFQRCDQIPDEVSNFLVAPVVAQTVQDDNPGAVFDVYFAPTTSKLAVLEDFFPPSPAKREQASFNLEAFAAGPTSVHNLSFAGYVFVVELAAFLPKLVSGAFLSCVFRKNSTIVKKSLMQFIKDIFF